MASIWERLAEGSRMYTVDDYERAAYRLVTAQVLSVNDQSTRKDYHLVAEHLREFKQVLEPLGIGLRHNSEYRYVVAQPRHVLNQAKASKTVTLLVLVLADIYHRIRFNGQQGDFGEAYVELPELQEAYQGMTGYDFPNRTGELRGLIAEVERWGIARMHNNDADPSQPFSVMIHPAISDIITKEWLGQLDGLRRQSDADETVGDEEVEEGDDVSA
jgi:Domain of unknown function (DUF4194)